MKIDWNVPDVKPGFSGAMEKFIGPGATKAEKQLQYFLPLVAGLSIVVYAYWSQLDWRWPQYLIAGLLSADIVGGIITNATSSAKRWYHREGQGFKQHLFFVTSHFVQLSLFSWAFFSFDLFWIVAVGGYMLLASITILLTPLYLQRPVALACYSLSILLCLYVFSAAEGMEWFLPLFYLKLLVSHILKEEPYRPEEQLSSGEKE
ncbi:hypothetical protein [Vibrio cidicii]|uniref:hypothetical protein n=1 Tax=Vibrio cidicii TaxID=1763883 RepID=UPI0018C2DBDF|nr:hypothetical protein [Vibrio cidicii]MBG0755603.1 hypothetical protein [Vibrio cidicii]